MEYASKMEDRDIHAKVLLVEDSRDIRAMMKILLEMYGVKVTEASDGYDAVEKAVASPPDLILMDIAMPVLDGIQATSVMRQHDSLHDVPIVCITAYGDYYEKEAMSAGCNEVLRKPLDLSELRPLVQRYL